MIQIDRCLDSGGIWNYKMHRCEKDSLTKEEKTLPVSQKHQGTIN